IGGVLELAVVDVQTDAAQLPCRQRRDQRLFVDDLPAGHVDQHRSGTHRRKRLATDQAGRLRCPLTTDGHEVTLSQQRMEMLGTFETAEARGQGVPRRNVTPRADDAHPRPGAQGSDRLPDPAGADDSHGLAIDLDWPVGAVTELLLLLVACRSVQYASEAEERGQDIFGYCADGAVAARRC